MDDNDPSSADPLGQIADEFVEAIRPPLKASLCSFRGRRERLQPAGNALLRLAIAAGHSSSEPPH